MLGSTEIGIARAVRNSSDRASVPQAREENKSYRVRLPL